MTKVYIWRCKEHGNMEFMQELEKAHCPFCGKELIFTSDTYEEATPKVVKRKQNAPTHVTVFTCPEHGEQEVLAEVKEAYCPICGKKMEYVAEY